MLTLSTLLLVIAVVLFVMQAFKIPKDRTWGADYLGWAFVVLAVIFWGGKPLISD